MKGDAVALRWFVAIATSAQVVGVELVVAGEIIGYRLIKEGVGGEAMNADDRLPLIAPFDIMEGEISGGDEVVKHWFRRHTLLLAVEIHAIYFLSRLSMGHLRPVAAVVNASVFYGCGWRHHATGDL